MEKQQRSIDPEQMHGAAEALQADDGVEVRPATTGHNLEAVEVDTFLDDDGEPYVLVLEWAVMLQALKALEADHLADYLQAAGYTSGRLAKADDVGADEVFEWGQERDAFGDLEELEENGGECPVCGGSFNAVVKRCTSCHRSVEQLERALEEIDKIAKGPGEDAGDAPAIGEPIKYDKLETFDEMSRADLVGTVNEFLRRGPDLDANEGKVLRAALEELENRGVGLEEVEDLERSTLARGQELEGWERRSNAQAERLRRISGRLEECRERAERLEALVAEYRGLLLEVTEAVELFTSSGQNRAEGVRRLQDLHERLEARKRVVFE